MKRLIFPALCLIVAIYFCIDNIGLSAEVERLKHPPAIPATVNPQEKRISDYLASKGAANPAIFAAACMETSNPELCAATALQESNCRLYCPNGAAGEVGPFQIIEGNWSWLVGKPSHDPFTAAKQWEIIHAHLREVTTSLPHSIFAYNGGGKGYVFTVWTNYRAMQKNSATVK